MIAWKLAAGLLAALTLMLLLIGWSLHFREEIAARKTFIVLAVIAGCAAMGAWAGGHWHS